MNEPQLLLGEGFAKLAPSLITERQTRPGQQQEPLSRFLPRKPSQGVMATSQPPQCGEKQLPCSWQLGRWTLVGCGGARKGLAVSGADS